jgi:23S rRNA (cytidine1920-2'-O)/16S rRNA (cytidine1409-2'-O)-methyltransferase
VAGLGIAHTSHAGDDRLANDGMRAVKLRLDNALVAQGLAPSRSQARDLIRRGCVSVDGKVAGKAGLEVGVAAAIVVAEGAQPYVSRGGLKLAAALAAFGFETSGIVALDIGASTGGFTDVLLQRGSRRIYAVDVGTGQLHPSLVGDARVIRLEATDARELSRADVPEAVDAIVADVSFVSLTQVLPAALSLAREKAWLIALIKPQFEAGREHVGKSGIVRSEAAIALAVDKVSGWIAAQPGWRVIGVTESPITGGSGNREMLIGARRDG